VRARALDALRDGVELDDGRTAPARVRRLAPDLLEITLHEGRKRQVRRMCEAVGHPVAELTRVAFGPLGLGSLAPGAARRLTEAEVERLRRAASRRHPRPGPARSPRSEPAGRPRSRRAA
jgi:23S rRNA pseudouridine2605 synthase